MTKNLAGPVAVLGGTGLIGRHVLEALRQAGTGPIVATHHRRPPFDAPDVRWCQADLAVPEGAREALKGARLAVICAGRLSTAAELKRDPVASVTATLRIGVNALEAAAQEGVERVVLVSSTTAYPAGAGAKTEEALFVGDPPDAWFGVGWTHRFLEKQLEWYCARLRRIGAGIVLRPTLVYGPHDDFDPASAHFVPSFIRRVVERERPIEIWGDGSQTRNLIHASDVASAILAGLSGTDEGFSAFNVAAEQSASVNDVLQLLIELDGFADAEVVRRLDRATGAAALEVSARAFTGRYGWRPAMPLREGLAGTLAWHRSTR
ncbi:NAD-dependent epimerase/dehydratase family protein [Reyranella sp.]|uniref:NAD-dependent epimerase/dehydratase family protein n=1 Tax=Reyranella sp. TaxID=1929291 RepID=UPI003D13455A